MAVIARDPDADKNGTVNYKIADNQPEGSNFNYFRIGVTDGIVYTNTDPDNLDR